MAQGIFPEEVIFKTVHNSEESGYILLLFPKVTQKVRCHKKWMFGAVTECPLLFLK